MMNDLIISNNDYLRYGLTYPSLKGAEPLPQDEEVDTLEWDYLDNRWIDNLGNCYKTLYDVPQFNLLFKELKDIIIAE